MELKEFNIELGKVNQLKESCLNPNPFSSNFTTSIVSVQPKWSSSKNLNFDFGESIPIQHI